MSLPQMTYVDILMDYRRFISTVAESVILTNIQLPALGATPVENVDYYTLPKVLAKMSDEKVFLILTYRSNEDIAMVSSMVSSNHQICGLLMCYDQYLSKQAAHSMKPETLQTYESGLLSSLFPELRENVIINEFYFTCNRTIFEYLPLDTPDVDAMLWNPVALAYTWRGLQKKKDGTFETMLLPGIHYILKDMVTLNNHTQLTWVNRLNQILSTSVPPGSGADIKKNLYLYDNVVKYLLWEKDSDQYLVSKASEDAIEIAEQGYYDRKDFVAKKVFESACTYFTKYLDNDPVMANKLCSMLAANPNKLFYFNSTYRYNGPLYEFLHKDTTLPKDEKIANKLAVFRQEKTREFIDFTNTIFVTPLVLGHALTHVVNTKIKKSEELAREFNRERKLIFNEFILDQMIRLSMKLNPFLTVLHQSLLQPNYVFDNQKVAPPTTIGRHDVMTILDELFECDFFKHTGSSLSDTRGLDILIKSLKGPLLPDFIKGETYDMIMTLLYQYGLSSCLQIQAVLEKKNPRVKPRPHDITLFMENLRLNHWYQKPTFHSTLFPHNKDVTGVLFEAFLEFSIVCMDLQDVPLSTATFLTMLVPFLFEYAVDDLKAIQFDFMKDNHNDRIVPWITADLVYHMYKENEIPMSLEEATQMHRILMNVFGLYNQQPYKKFMNKFMNQLCGRHNLLPMELVDKSEPAPVDNLDGLLKEQLMLRSKPIPDELRDELDQFAVAIKNARPENRATLMNRSNLRVAFSTNSLHRAHPEMDVYYTKNNNERIWRKYNVEAIKNKDERSKALYEIYKKRDVYLFPEDDVHELRMLLTQLSVQNVLMQCKITHNELNVFLASMNENNPVSLILCCSILRQLAVNKGPLFLSKEQSNFFVRMVDHIEWAMKSEPASFHQTLFGNLALVNLIQSKRTSHIELVEHVDVYDISL